MNFEWTTEQAEFAKKVAEVFDQDALDELAVMEELDEPGIKELLKKYSAALGNAGYISAGQGPDGGGQTMKLLAAQEQFAKVNGSLFLAIETSARLFGGLIAGFGNDNLKSSMLGNLNIGAIIGAVAVSEEEPEGSTGPGTFAEKDGDGYILNGKKNFVTNGPVADYVAVFGHVDGKPTFFIVGTGEDGLTFGDRIRTMGYQGLAVCSMKFDGVKVPASNVLGPFDDSTALDYLKRVETFTLAVLSAGLGNRLFAAAQAYSKTHRRAGKEIYKHQEIGFKLAEMLTLNHGVDFLCRRAAWMWTKGDPETDTLVNCAKVFAADSAEAVATKAMQILAGSGYISGNEVEKGYRDAKYAAIAGTTNEVARMQIADDVLTKFQV